MNEIKKNQEHNKYIVENIDHLCFIYQCASTPPTGIGIFEAADLLIKVKPPNEKIR